jgi:Tol biopolymer transport system component
VLQPVREATLQETDAGLIARAKGRRGAGLSLTRLQSALSWTDRLSRSRSEVRVQGRPDQVRLVLGFVAAVVIVAALPTGAGGGVEVRNGDVIAFTRWFSPPRQVALALIGTDGRGLRPVRTGVSPSYEAEWSPNGRWLLFRGGRTDDLYVIRPDGSQRRQLTHGPAHGQAADWSPDGTRIAFQRWAPHTFSSIWVLRVATGAATRLTPDALGAGHPSWSPDGSRIVFVSATPKSGYEPELWTMNANGSGRRHLFPRLTGASHPAWSPDGRRLLVTDGSELYVLDSTTGRVQVKIALRASAAGEKTDPFPEWSPDGERIVFDQLDADGRPGIWIVSADGTRPHRVIGASRAVRGASDPSWKPTPH